MRNLPEKLCTKEINSFINEMISFQDAKDFHSLDETYQDQFVALCIRSLGCDVELILGTSGNQYLVNFLLSYDRDEEIKVMQELKKSAREQFCIYFDELINEAKYDHYIESMYTAGKSKVINQSNGEYIWI